jgi:uncharacterized protein
MPPDLPALWKLAWKTQRSHFMTHHHGIEHWVRVERNGLWLAGQVDGVDVLVVRLFAALHDCQRRNDGWDPDHGPRAAEFLQGLDLGLEPARLDELVTAVRTHTSGPTADSPTIRVCHDADRLDLGRVGTKLDARFLNTPPAIDLARRDAPEELDQKVLDVTLPEYLKPTPRWDRWG